ncbi:MAG: xylulokinase, partial [Phototrophicaceae bacterium]
SYPTEYSAGNRAEQDPNDWWRAVCQSTRAVIAQAGIRAEDIAGVVFGGMMQGVVALDSQGLPLRKAIIWADQRATAQAEQLRAALGDDLIYRTTGHRPSAAYSLPKIMWLRDHEPALYAATYQFAHVKDAMIARLTGQFVTEPSDASGMNLYDLQAGGWSSAILNAAGIDAAKLPTVVASTQVVGGVLASVAEEIGLKAGTAVVAGGGDGACASVGAGSVVAGVGYSYVGTSAWVATASTTPLFDPLMRTFTFGHVVPGLMIPMGTMQAAGGAYQWTRDTLGGLEQQAAQLLGISVYELMNAVADQSPAGANELVFLPYLLGERAPRWNPQARAAFVGLTVQHTRADMLRAVLEGVTFNLKAILDILNGLGAEITDLRVIGGGVSGGFWRQIMADVYGVPLHRLVLLEEATSMGAAVIGGVGVGLYPDFNVALQMNPISATVTPNPQQRATYDRAAQLFEATYSALAPIYAQMDAAD